MAPGESATAGEAVVFPTDAEELTPELLARALASRQPGVRVDAVEILETAHCNSGSASTAGRAKLRLAFSPGASEGLPERMVLKTVLVRPGAPFAMYANEARFYRELRPALGVETPQVFASADDEASGSFGILMEDVSLRPARFPNALTSLSGDEVRSLLRNLARLHAGFWRSPRFASDLSWLWTPLSGGFHDVMQGIGLDLIGAHLERSEAKQAAVARLGRKLPELWEALWSAQRILASEPVTLLHGDCHLGNCYLLPGGEAGLLDWQLFGRGRWAQDVTYILTTGLDVETRRRDERDLLAYYLEHLAQGGVDPVPTPDEAWLLHRQTAIWGLVIGWMTCPVENYGPEVLAANLERLVTAIEDLETFRALGR